MPSESLICSGLVERIGTGDALLKYKSNGTDIRKTFDLKNHRKALQKILEYLMDPIIGGIQNKEDIKAIGHRVVHGSNVFSDTTLIDEQVKKEIRESGALAPLHNPPNLEGIIVAEEFFPLAKQVAVFDTAFHQSIPEMAKRYAIPTRLYNEHSIQVYGFHGISHKYVSEKAIEYLGLTKSKIITIHLGNGCSMTAVRDGKSIDHSMGFTPSNGLIMGSRSGDIDHGVIFHLVNNLGYDVDAINKLLTKESGMLGLTGYNDLRDIEAEANRGNKECKLALQMKAYRIRKYIGAYTAAMNGLDAIIFTAGIGENSTLIRKLVCAEMDFFGLELDDDKNEWISDSVREINVSSSPVKVLVVPTNEELEIAYQAYEYSVRD